MTIAQSGASGRCLRRVLADLLLVPTVFYLALLLYFEGNIPSHYIPVFARWILFIILVYSGFNLAFGNYRRLWVYAGVREALSMAQSAALSTLVVLAMYVLTPVPRRLPLGVIVCGGMLFFFCEGVVHFRREFLLKLHLHNNQLLSPRRTRVLILGVCAEARQLAHSLRNDLLGRYHVVGFLDDSERNLGMTVEGLPVLDEIRELPQIVSLHDIDLVVIAKRAQRRAKFREVLALCTGTNAQIKILPRTMELIANNQVDPLDLRDVTIQDLLDREPIRIDEMSCRLTIEGKVVMVTGACGSIGSEICRQISGLAPRLLVMVDQDESGLHDLNVELRASFTRPNTQVVLANVASARKMQWVFETYRPEIVYHSAAYKHVPMMEDYPDEAVNTNVQGSIVVSEFAHRYNVGHFVFISTDKAVNPSSVMGASKRIGEMWISALQKTSGTAFSIVRFGNVIGSRGSVVTTFTRQIEKGGVVTITDPRMTRYFISIAEAVSLVVQATAYAEGGDIFMLDMGEEVRILDLANRMIRLKGLRVNVDVHTEFIGCRAGEKLHEELCYADEEREPTPHPRIFCLKGPEFVGGKDLLLSTSMLLAEVARFPALSQDLRASMLELAHGNIDAFLDRLISAEWVTSRQRPELEARGEHGLQSGTVQKVF
jgi:FlaA1/EpsC-like NDP-sugar epimerase